MNNNAAFIAFLNQYLALFTLVGFIIAILWLLKIIAHHYGFLRKYKHWMEHVARFAHPLGFLIALFAMIMSLYYSYFLNIAPCELCWFQRIFLYPQVLLFGLAWYKRDKEIYDYSIVLSAIGLFIAVYQHYLQMGYSLYTPCSTAPFAVDCAAPTFLEFGFVTYPFMSVVTFSILLLLAYTAKKFRKIE